MKKFARAAVVLGVVSALLLPALPSSAGHLEIEVVEPGDVSAGETVQLRVIVRTAETGERVTGATVIAFREATLAGYTGQVEVARAVTDDIGLATLQWMVRGGPNETVVVAYSAPGGDHFESEPLSVLTVGSGPQLERSTAGVKIPGLGAWVLIVVLVGIWVVIQFALVGPVQVASDGYEGEDPGGSPAEAASGSS